MCKEIMKIYFAVFLIIILLGISIALAEEADKINDEVYNKLIGSDETTVIIQVSEGNSELMNERNIANVERILEEPIVRIENIIFANVSIDEISILEENKLVERVDPSLRLYAALQDSKGIVNAFNASAAQINGINLTGIDETICIIDSGIDFTHPALIGKNKTCVIDCYEKECAEDCAVGDDNGHGTHVAGIIASQMGIAPGVSLIGLRILNAAGTSSESGAVDLKNAIDWCADNSEEYNISVISMSLGTEETYTSFCDISYWPLLTGSVNSAVGKNISVIAASGNSNTDRKTNAIIAPACIENATAVSATNKDDSISSYGHYSSFTDFFAPGTSINSTYKNSGYAILSGTSMSTPHVAAAFALVNQFYRLQNNSDIKQRDAENSLKARGENITTVPGFKIPRINIFNTIVYLDGIRPSVNLILPLDNGWDIDGNVTFGCNASDLSLKNVTFYLWNSTSLYNQIFRNATAGYTLFEINQTNLLLGSYEWNCLFGDEHGNTGFASVNSSFNVGGIDISLVSPESRYYTNNNFSNFSCRARSEERYALKNVTFYLWNATMLRYNETKNIIGSENVTGFNYTLDKEGGYEWNCLAYNNATNSSWAEDNSSLYYDLSLPVINLSYPAEGYSALSGTFIFGFNVSDRIGLANCSLLLNGVVAASNLSIINNSVNTISYNLGVGDYIWGINCTDLAGNMGNSSLRSVSASAAPQVVLTSSGGGGGGGGGAPRVFYITDSDMASVYYKDLSVSEGIRFTLGFKNERHSVSVKEIKDSYANFLVESDPINLKLYIGQDVKLNLTSGEFYDLYVKLEGINNNRVNISVKEIMEIIPIQPPKGGIYAANNSENETESVNKTNWQRKFMSDREMMILIVGFAVFVIIFVGILVEHRKARFITHKEE